jgi:transglutaminase-like putative cysteine protease
VIRLVMVLAVAAVATAADVDDWYKVSLNGVHAGWGHVTERISGDVRTMTSTESISIGRGAAEVTVVATTVWVDHVDGTPVSMTWTQEMGDQPVETVWRFRDDEIDIRTTQDGRVNRSTRAAPSEPWLTPAAAQEELARRAAAGETRMSWRTMVPDLGATAVLQRMEFLGEQTETLAGQAGALSRWKVTIEGLPVAMETAFSSSWRPVINTLRAPFGDIRSVLSTRAEATAALGGPPPELFVSLFVEPSSGTIDRQLEATRAFMRLRTRDGEPLDLPSSGAQTIAGARDGAVLLQVNASGGQPPVRPVDMHACLAPSGMIDAGDEAIRRFASQAVADVPQDAASRAEALREAVHSWISTKGLTTAFASASETVRKRTGDCSEHGVLLAAALRAEGIPSRVATGLVWMGALDAFGWHMWTQAFIDGAWVDLDATLPTPFSVGHILVATSTLQDGDGQRQLTGLLTLLGNLEVDIIRVDR